MKQVLFVNCETTGLPKKNGTVTKDNIDNWPRLVSLHLKVGHFDKESKKIVIGRKLYCIVKPDGYHIPKISTKFHMITNEIAEKKGNNIRKCLDEFVKILSTVKFIVGHNVMFDINTIQAELLRYNYNVDLYKYDLIDTINFRHEYEYPKLENLYELLFGRKFKKSHPRKSNINIIIKCFEKLYSNYKTKDN